MVEEESQEILLGAPRMQLDLIDRRLGLAVSEHVSEQLRIEVGHTNCPGQAHLFQLLHLRPEDVHGHLGRAEAIKWPVNQVHIDILQAKLLKRLSKGLLRILVLCMPYLRRNEKLLALDGPAGDAIGNTLANYLLITVERGSV